MAPPRGPASLPKPHTERTPNESACARAPARARAPPILFSLSPSISDLAPCLQSAPRVAPSAAATAAAVGAAAAAEAAAAAAAAAALPPPVAKVLPAKRSSHHNGDDDDAEWDE